MTIKKAFFLLNASAVVAIMTLAACVCDCDEYKKVDTEKAEYISKEKLEIPQVCPDSSISYHPLKVIRFKYEGHYYIGFHQYDTQNGVVHDPDCFTCKQNAVEEYQKIYESILGEVRDMLKDHADDIKKTIARNTTSIINKIETDIDYE